MQSRIYLHVRRMGAQRTLLVAAMGLAMSLSAGAQTVHATGSSTHLGGGVHDFGCTDVLINGALTLGAGASVTGVKSLTISPTGSLNLSGASMELAEQFSNLGAVTADAGTLSRVGTSNCPAVGTPGRINLNPQQAITPVPTLDVLGLGLLSAALALIAGMVTRRRRAP